MTGVQSTSCHQLPGTSVSQLLPGPPSLGESSLSDRVRPGMLLVMTAIASRRLCGSLLGSLLPCGPRLLQLIGAYPHLACACTKARMLAAPHIQPMTGQMAVSFTLTAAGHAFIRSLQESCTVRDVSMHAQLLVYSMYSGPLRSPAWDCRHTAAALSSLHSDLYRAQNRLQTGGLHAAHLSFAKNCSCSIVCEWLLFIPLPNVEGAADCLLTCKGTPIH